VFLFILDINQHNHPDNIPFQSFRFPTAVLPKHENRQITYWIQARIKVFLGPGPNGRSSPLHTTNTVPLLAMQAPGGRGSIYSSYSFLTSALDEGEWSASRPSRSLRPGKDPGTHWIGGWVRLRAGLDAEATGKVLCLCRVSSPGRPVCSQTL
jgi:hypothetical protein